MSEPPRSRRTCLPTTKRIAVAWLDAGDLPAKLGGMSALYLRSTCWGCLAEEITPERAHVVAASHGGGSDPLNFFLLCGRCHRAQPDGADRSVQCLWLATVASSVAQAVRGAKLIAAHLVAACDAQGVELSEVNRQMEREPMWLKLGLDATRSATGRHEARIINMAWQSVAKIKAAAKH